MLEVYTLNIEKSLPSHLKEIFLQQVSEEKRCKIARYRREIDGQRTLLGEVLIRVMLGGHLKISPKHLVFKENEYGKPYLEGNPLYFNISHSGDWVVAAISDAPVGIDVEQVRQADLGIAERFFAVSEYNAIKASAYKDKQNQLFYTLWSGKESYIKMIGKGLTISLDSFTLTYQEEKLTLKSAYEGQEAYFTVYPFEEEYSLVVCHEKEVPYSHYREVTINQLYNMVEEDLF